MSVLPPRGSPAVVAEGLVKTYGERRAVDAIEFEVRDGVCFGFLGPNGAGKTTTMRMLYGRLRRDSGRLEVLGLDPDRSRRDVRERLGVVTQANDLDQELTVLENLVVFAGHFGRRGRAARSRARELLEFFDLDDRAGSSVRDLSGGLQRRLLIARSMMHDPELLVLDEPTTGLDPQARIVVWQRIAELRQRGVTVVLTTHYMEEAARLCEQVVVMDEGRIVERGAPRDLILRHAGEQVVEVRWPLGTPAPAAGPEVRRIDLLGDRLLLFADNPAAALGLVRGRVDSDAAIVRPATLEDVFIHLTGRRLEDGE
ncbi:MAG TPA: ABC transporter ATP-binding protein [Terriglobales bacterium]|nr:ABC transporter ATP-binding protein [Terriglobales bacterium]